MSRLEEGYFAKSSNLALETHSCSSWGNSPRHLKFHFDMSTRLPAVLTIFRQQGDGILELDPNSWAVHSNGAMENLEDQKFGPA